MIDYNEASSSWVTTKRVLRVERHLNCVVVPPIVDPRMPSGLHGFFGGVYRVDGAHVDLALMTRGGGLPIIYEAKDRKIGLPVRMQGRALYGGAMFAHYGHFLLESTARLWAARLEQFDHVVFQLPHGASRNLLEYQKTFLSSLGLLDRVLLVATADPAVCFDEVVVVEPCFELGRSVNRAIRKTFASFRTDASANRSVYLSRLNMSHGVVVGEKIIQSLFKHLGYEVFYPEQHSLKEQLEVYSNTRRLAGILGSAMHNILFMPIGTEVINIVRSAQAPMASFFLTDDVMNARAFYIDGIDYEIIRDHPDRGPPGPFVLDIASIIDALGKCETINQDLLRSFHYDATDLGNDYRMKWHLAQAAAYLQTGDVDKHQAEIKKIKQLLPCVAA